MVVASMVVVVERGISRSDGTMGRRSRRSKRGAEEVQEEGVEVWAVRLAEGAEEEGVVEDRRLRLVALVEGEAAAARRRIIKAITTISSTAIMEAVEGYNPNSWAPNNPSPQNLPPPNPGLGWRWWRRREPWRWWSVGPAAERAAESHGASRTASAAQQ